MWPLLGSKFIAKSFEWVSGVRFQVSDFGCKALGTEYAAFFHLDKTGRYRGQRLD